MKTSPLQELVESIRKQIQLGDVNLALDRLHNYLDASSPKLRDEVIIHQARYNRLQKQERMGLMSREDAQVGLNRLSSALLALLEKMPDEISNEALPATGSTMTSEPASIPEEVSLEKILGVNNLKQIAWIEKGIQVAKSVCRILTPSGFGTGFLIAPSLLMTNHHVIPNETIASTSVIEFDYQWNFEGKPIASCRYEIDASIYQSNANLDYTIVGVKADPQKPNVENWGYLILNANADPVPREHVIIIQHPNGGPKQIALTANQVVNRWNYRLQYTTDTMPGSSGSPVFNDFWEVIAIHHAGGDLKTNAKGDTRFINEGILMSAIRGNMGELWPS